MSEREQGDLLNPEESEATRDPVDRIREATRLHLSGQISEEERIKIVQAAEEEIRQNRRPPRIVTGEIETTEALRDPWRQDEQGRAEGIDALEESKRNERFTGRRAR